LKYLRIGGEQTDGILIEWATASEKNFDFFSLETSSDGIAFREIGRMKGKGDSGKATLYSFLHTTAVTAVSGRNYYRLKCIDLDETYEYSQTVVSHWKGNRGSIALYPNPTANRKVKILVSDEFPEIQKMVLLDQTGTAVWESSDNASTFDIELPETVKSGVYILSFFTNGGRQNRRLVLK
jgi:hypothetical protein